MPKLIFDPSPFHEGLKKLQERRYGHEMLTYKPPKDDPFESIFAEPESGGATNGSNGNSASNGIDLAVIFQSWGDLHQNTRQNLLKFEDPEFELRTQAEGEEYVRQLVSLSPCRRFYLSYTPRIRFFNGNAAQRAQRHCQALPSLPSWFQNGRS